MLLLEGNPVSGLLAIWTSGRPSRPPSVATIRLPAMITVVIMAMMPPVMPVWPAATEQQQTGQHHNPCSLAFHVRTSDKRSQGLLTLDRTQSGCSGRRKPLVIFPRQVSCSGWPRLRVWRAPQPGSGYDIEKHISRRQVQYQHSHHAENHVIAVILSHLCVPRMINVSGLQQFLFQRRGKAMQREEQG